MSQELVGDHFDDSLEIFGFFLETDLEHDGPQNWSWRFQWSQLTSDIRNRLKRLTQIYGRDMKYGKAIPPEDMIMKDNSKCLLQ